VSKEHETITVTVKCANIICGVEHTAFALVHGGQNKKIQCPACGIMTSQKNLKVIEKYKPVTFSNK